MKDSKYYLKLFLVFIVLQVFFTHKSFGQNIFIKDSIQLESLTKGMDSFYQNPLQYKKNLPIASVLTDNLLKVYPTNDYLLRKKVDIMHYSYYFIKRNFNDSITLNYIQEAKKLRKKIGDTCGLQVVYRQFSGFWKTKRNYNKAEEYSSKAYEIAKRCNDSVAMNLALLSKIQADYLKNRTRKHLNTSVLIDLKIILNKAIEKQEYRTIVIASDHITDMYLYHRQYDSIGRYLKLSEAACLKRKDYIKLKLIYRKQGTYYKRGEHNITKALPYYKKSVALNEQLQDSIGLIKAYLGLSNTLSDLGQHKMALDYFKKHVFLEKKAVNVKSYRKISDLEASFKYREQKKVDSLELIQFEKEKIYAIKTKENKRFWGATISFLIILIVGVFVFFSYKRKLLLKELVNLKLQKKVERKTDQVESLLTESVTYIKQRKRIAKDLKNLSHNTSEVSLNGILATLKSESIADSKLLTLRADLEKNSYDFTSRLKSEYPRLTKGDLEVCALIRLNIPRKQIAIIRGTTEESLKTARNRVRKKLELPKDILLNDFITKF